MSEINKWLNNLPERNRRRSFLLGVGGRFRRAVHARVGALGGGRSANREKIENHQNPLVQVADCQ